MATYRVWSGAGGANNGTSWTDAYTTFGSAVTAATTAGDVILVHYTHQDAIAANTTYTFGADNIQVWSVDKDSSDAPTVMGAGGWLGNGASSFSMTFTAANRKVYYYGITFQLAGASGVAVSINGDGCNQVFENCYFWIGSTNAGAGLFLGGTADQNCFVDAVNTTFRFGSTSHSIKHGGRVILQGGSVSSDGSAINTVFAPVQATDQSCADLEVHGMDISAASSTATIVGNTTVSPQVVRMYACKLPSGAITYIATQTNVNRSSSELWMHDCAAGDSHLQFVYANAMGSVELQTSINYTSTGASWKVTTTAAPTFTTPFETPWIDFYNEATSAITPYFEVLRDGSATAYTDAQVWAEFSVKSTTGFVTPTFTSDRQTLTNYLAGTAGASQATGAGLGSWTGEGGTAWSGKVDSGSAVTPAETGYIRGRVVVAAASSIVYVDPVIRT